MSIFNNIFNKEEQTLSSLIPVIGFENDAFLLKDNFYMDIVEIVSKDLLNLSADERAYDNMNFAKFYKTFPSEIEIIGLNFPTDTKTQQKYFLDKINTTNNAVFRRRLEEKLEELEYLEKHNTEREYYIIFFSEGIEEHHNNLTMILRSLGSSGQIKPIAETKKKQILYKINNKNSSIFI